MTSPSVHPRVTIRSPEWAYFNLQMIWETPTPASADHPDLLTWRTALTHALKQFLGLEGTAIHIDFLHLHEDEVWLRIPSTAMTKFSAAVSGYMGSVEGKSFGFKTIAAGEHLMGLMGRRAEEEEGIWAE